MGETEPLDNTYEVWDFDGASIWEAINQLIADPDYFVKISIWCSGYTFEMSGQTLAKLSAFAEYVAVTCWDEEEM